MAAEEINYIREYKSSDRDQVYSLILSIFVFEFKNIPPEKYLEDLNDMEKVYGGSGEAFWVCEKNDKIIGTIAIKKDDEKTALLRRFFVNPNYRGKGLGKSLLVQALDFVKTKKYEKVVFIGNPQMKNVKKVLMVNGFQEDDDFIFKGMSVFKLIYNC